MEYSHKITKWKPNREFLGIPAIVFQVSILNTYRHCLTSSHCQTIFRHAQAYLVTKCVCGGGEGATPPKEYGLAWFNKELSRKDRFISGLIISPQYITIAGSCIQGSHHTSIISLLYDICFLL